MEIFLGMDFALEEGHTKLDIVLNKFQEPCLGKTNETYERFLFNSQQKKENETIDQYVTALQTLAQTCNFCTCLQDSLIHDQLVIRINDNATQKKLLQDRKLALSKAIDLCQSSETTRKQIKKLHKAREEAISTIKTDRNETRSHEAKIQCKYCSRIHLRKKEFCPALGS